MSQHIPSVILPEKFLLSKLSNTPIKETQDRYYASPKYNNDDFVFQILPMKLMDNGITKPTHYMDTDIKRSFIKPQLDSTQPNCIGTYNMLQEVTTWFQSNYQTILGTDEVYLITPLIANSCCTLKFNLEYPTGKILTKCFITKNKMREPIENPTINDLQPHMRRGSTFQALVHVEKIWFNKQIQEKTGLKLAGIKLTLLQLEIIKEYQPRIPIQMKFSEYKMIDTETKKNEEIEI